MSWHSVGGSGGGRGVGGVEEGGDGMDGDWVTLEFRGDFKMVG